MQFKNSASARFCSRCARPLDEAAAVQFESVREDADEITTLFNQKVIEKAPEIATLIFKDPEFRSKWQKFERILKNPKLSRNRWVERRDLVYF